MPVNGWRLYCSPWEFGREYRGEITVALAVLVVDRNQELQRDLQLLLEGNGYRVIRACNPAEALEFSLADRPQIIITEILFNNVKAETFLHALRGL